MRDILQLTQELIRCPSVTPVDAGALSVVEQALQPLGFSCHRLTFGQGSDQIDNLWAYRPGRGKHIAFAGHTDVVPAGQTHAWRYPPFEGRIENGVLYGRGAVDMKGAIAAFIAAIRELVDQEAMICPVSFFITGDEEGPALYGTKKLLEWVKEKNLLPDYCLVGEPTSDKKIGDTLKIGRRGSLNIILKEKGTQGHVAYAEKADNPIPRFLKCLLSLQHYTLDSGHPYFPPSHLEITSIDVGNQAFNVIPAEISASFNIRFNAHHMGQQLIHWVESQAQTYLKHYSLVPSLSGEAFYCPDQNFIKLVQKAVQEVTGLIPSPQTTGGTSDARFIYPYCPVLEMGLCHGLAHHVDEAVSLTDLYTLTHIYKNILHYFSTP